jgi:CRISPR-associated protein Cas2
MVTRYFVAYDIADPDRLRKVHAVVKASAQRVQDSVYEALMTEKERVLLEERLRMVMNQKEDMVMFINLGDAGRRELSEVTTLGQPYRPVVRGSIVI